MIPIGSRIRVLNEYNLDFVGLFNNQKSIEATFLNQQGNIFNGISPSIAGRNIELDCGEIWRIPIDSIIEFIDFPKKYYIKFDVNQSSTVLSKFNNHFNLNLDLEKNYDTFLVENNIIIDSFFYGSLNKDYPLLNCNDWEKLVNKLDICPKLKPGDWIYLLDTGCKWGLWKGDLKTGLHQIEKVKDNIIYDRCYSLVNVDPSISIVFSSKNWRKYIRLATKQEIDDFLISKINYGNVLLNNFNLKSTTNESSTKKQGKTVNLFGNPQRITTGQRRKGITVRG